MCPNARTFNCQVSLGESRHHDIDARRNALVKGSTPSDGMWVRGRRQVERLQVAAMEMVAGNR
jgi:hypothetical protein